jgi:hypothetical protein
MRLTRLTLILTIMMSAACAGNMAHMTTYEGAAESFSTDECGQFCWSQHRPTSYEEISGAGACRDSDAANALNDCAVQLRKSGSLFVDKRPARSELEECMRAKGWWRVTVKIVICE